MFRLGLLIGPIVLIVWVYCVFDVIRSRNDDVRNLPRIGWLLLVLLFPFVGSIAWLAAGRPRVERRVSPYEREVPQFPEYDRPGRASALDAETDEEFLRRCRERAEQQRKNYRRTQGDADEAE